MKHAKIPLSGKLGKGKYMLVDIEDVPRITKVKWHLSDTGYVINRNSIGSTKTTIRAHRLIMDTPAGMDTDHINHNKLDNRKSNLRICTRSENLMNRLDVKGYYYSKSRNRYIVDSKAINVSWKQFKTEEEAKRFVYNERLKRQ